MEDIDNFVENLAKEPIGINTINIYDDSNDKNEIRRDNLKLYLKKMKNMNPKIILIGEAPGFRGCRFTGIPFTSEYVLSHNQFFYNNGYEPTNENPKPKKEGTATIVWEAIDKHKQYPLLWNAFPFHPHEEKNHSENRTPNKDELKIGKIFLNEVFKLFPSLDNKVGAIGLIAEDLLKNKMKVPCTYITHPSFGRKIKFRYDLKKFLEIN